MDSDYDDSMESDSYFLGKIRDHKNQPYMQKPKFIASKRHIKEFGNHYFPNEVVKFSTDSAKLSLKEFKQSVLEKCQSSFGTFYQSCFDDFLAYQDGLSGNVMETEVIEEVAANEEKKLKTMAKITAEMERRSKEPGCLNRFIVFNEPKRSREGLACQCSKSEKSTGIHHGYYPGEKAIPHCIRDSNNLDKLTHYVLKVTKLSNNSAQPSTYFQIKNEIYYFEGFSIFLHQSYPRRFPTTALNYLYDDYVWELLEEPPPTNFTVEELEAFHDYLFGNILEMFDLNRFAANLTLEDSCPFYHCMPRFITTRNNGERMMLPMCEVLKHLRKNFTPANLKKETVSELVGQIILNPEKRPKALRIDELYVAGDSKATLVHYGIMPKYVDNLPKPAEFEGKDYEKFRTARFFDFFLNEHELGSHFYKTGLFPDMTVHGLHLISAISHIRIRISICHFENNVLGCSFNEPIVLELALMQKSFKGNYGTNVSHCRTAWINCGYAYPLSYPTRIFKRLGFKNLQEAMNVLMPKQKTENGFKRKFDNERLKLFGDAVIGFIVATRLFLMYPNYNVSLLSGFRSKLVRNQTLAFLGKQLGLQNYLLYEHVTGLSTPEMDDILADAVEAVMGAIFLDQGIQFVDEFLGKLMFGDCLEALEKWSKPPEYILKRDYPNGDRHLINRIDFLKKLTELEDSIGIYFRHIRILSRVFVKSQDGDNYLTLGNYETLEFLGDSVLQLAVTVKLYFMFPYESPSFLTLLRLSLVSNATLAMIFDYLRFENYITDILTIERKKTKADIIEAFIGGLYIDKGIEICYAFCDVCCFSKIKRFIIVQTSNDPKVLLRQCCLVASTNRDPQVPTYKPLQQLGSSLNRQYEVGVYISGNRLATGFGPNMKQAEMDAALEALMIHDNLFPVSTIAKICFKFKDNPVKNSKEYNCESYSAEE